MFIKIMLSYVLGYLKLSVEGYYIERFINICKNNKITIWNLKRNKEIELYLNVRISEFKKICEIAKKTKCKIKIKNKKGIPFLLHKYKKRKIFLILLILITCFIGMECGNKGRKWPEIGKYRKRHRKCRTKNRNFKIKSENQGNYK